MSSPDSVNDAPNQPRARSRRGSLVILAAAMGVALAAGSCSTPPAGPPATTIPILPFAAVSVSAGVTHTCAVSTAGEVWCWGDNESGQLGDGTVADRLQPRPVAGLTNVRTVATGLGTTCAVTQSGAVRCWGSNSRGQLGDGTFDDKLVPSPVSGLGAGVDTVVVGAAHACARLTSGTVSCWGDNTVGQLGTGSTSASNVPVQVAALSGVSSLAPGGGGNDHTCAVVAGGAVKCWGNNYAGQLGDGTILDRTAPVAVAGLTGAAVAVATGARHTCALYASGTAACWGFHGGSVLGDGGVFGLGTYSTSPVPVFGLAGATSIRAGGLHTCAVVAGGAAKCWGLNIMGSVGDGTFHDRNEPKVAVPSGSASVGAGAGHACAVLTSGTVKCWGLNDSGQLGIGRTGDSPSPLQVPGT